MSKRVIVVTGGTGALGRAVVHWFGTQGDQVHVPSETLIEFVLQQDIRMPVATATAGS